MLRQIRQSAGKSREEAAGWLEITVQTLSKVELGRQAIKGPHVRLLCQLYGTDAGTMDNMLRLAQEANQRGWWTSYRDTVPEWFRQFVGFECDASTLWEYQAEFVPGLLQTPAYAEAITRAARPDIGDTELARVVQVRRERQEQFNAGDPAELNAFLNEAILRRVVGSAETMREQLDHLSAASKWDHVSLRVVPFSAGAHAAMAASFVLMQFPEEEAPAFAYLENDRGAVYQEDPGDVERYTVMIEQLDGLAASADDSRVMLDKAARSQQA
ncbi:helix-turn-helix domain-containing protein [Saccharopolyspora sp. HNM0983]|uniref:Helix-turn-helix domain-containing protein n=1 Tax=Saccharopolyspora montiporae TaxID=2781240 RepID=A0A929BA69_9PSEU|nr:helix-turn-helix transcriptional regulator [Saccharopolyspora sp. HNM0983]MBE9376114.1 helix-turn-helix domain-containing protein [Saccharopolyspora sp. HNM0983]